MINLTPAELTTLLRMRLGITQTRLSQDLGTPTVTINQVEHGDRLPSWTLLDNAAKLGGYYLAWAQAIARYRAPNLFDDCEEKLVEAENV